MSQRPKHPCRARDLQQGCSGGHNKAEVQLRNAVSIYPVSEILLELIRQAST